MKHLVLGNGNLGRDIVKQLTRIGEEVHTLSSSTGWTYPRNESQIEIFNKYDVFWVTVGAGSIEGANKDFSKYCDLHIRLPMQILQTIDQNKKVFLFSTDYLQCKNPNRNLYTLSKKMMEESVKIMNRPNCVIYRVGSLYGTSKPMSTFPGKCYVNNVKKKSYSLPRNIVIPTPTDWLADQLVMEWERIRQFHFKTRITHVAPSGDTTVSGWGETLFSDEKELITFFDKSRPKRSHSCYGVNELISRDDIKNSWLALWLERRERMIKAIKLANGHAC